MTGCVGGVSEEPRVRVAFAAERRGIASALNGAGTLADGEYVTFLDQDDVLAPTALRFLAEALQRTDVRRPVLGRRLDRRRPAGAFDPTSNRTGPPNYWPDVCTSAICLPPGMIWLRRRGGFVSGFEGAQDYDLALRLAGSGASVKHVARVLYHWRMHDGSTAAVAGAKPHAHMSGKRALEEALRAGGI